MVPSSFLGTYRKRRSGFYSNLPIRLSASRDCTSVSIHKGKRIMKAALLLFIYTLFSPVAFATSDLPNCSQIEGRVFCGYDCTKIQAAVYCGQKSHHTCVEIEGRAYCGVNCKKNDSAVYCGDRGVALPAFPAHALN